MAQAWHSLVALALALALALVLAPVVSGACQPLDPQVAAVSMPTSGNYAVIVDAGSSGSRIRVYTWEDQKDLYKLPSIREVYCFPKTPGVSDCATHQELAEHILELVGMAAKFVPTDLHEKSSIYFKATAGMRLMPEDNANEAIKFINSLFSNRTLNPFRYVHSPDNPQILSGEEEGLFAWIAANYLAKVFDPDGSHKKQTYGILELGGASTQIAFEHQGIILANKLPVHVAGVTYNLYVHSYLIYGQDKVDGWIKDRVLAESQKTTQNNIMVANPCMLSGDVVANRTNVTFYGTGDPANCTRLLNELIYKPIEHWRCNPSPCGIGTTYQPSIHPTQQFYAVGAFGYPLKGLGVLEKDGSFSLEATTKAAFNFCSMPIDTIRSNRQISMETPQGIERSRYLSRECLTGLYMPILFKKAYRFKDTPRQILAPKTVGDSEIEWPLGAVIYEYERTRCKPHCLRELRHPCPSASSASSIFDLSLRVYLGHVLIYGLAISRFLSLAVF